MRDDQEQFSSEVKVKVSSLLEGVSLDHKEKDIPEDKNETGGQHEEEPISIPSPQQLTAIRKQVLRCPITRLPLKDPVVSRKDGVTYERQALRAMEGGGSGDGSHSYTNRALLDYMAPGTNPLEELQHSSPTKIGIFFCPITGDLMRDPVIDPEGHTYERAAIMDWLDQQQGVSPITRNPLQAQQLYDNTTLFRVLYREIQSAPKSVTDTTAIQTWKQDVSRFNYLTHNNQPTKNTTSSSHQPEQSTAYHPSHMRVDHNGRWRQRNKNTVTLIGLVLVCLCVTVFLFLEFPTVALWCLAALVVLGVLYGLFQLCTRPRDGQG